MWNSLPDSFVTVPIASCFKIKLDKFYCGFTVCSFYQFFSVRFSCILTSGVLLKIEVGIRKGAWQRD